MAIFGSGSRILWALLAFMSSIHGRAASPDPINDFCALSNHMSRNAVHRLSFSSMALNIC